MSLIFLASTPQTQPVLFRFLSIQRPPSRDQSQRTLYRFRDRWPERLMPLQFGHGGLATTHWRDAMNRSTRDEP